MRRLSGGRLGFVRRFTQPYETVLRALCRRCWFALPLERPRSFIYLSPGWRSRDFCRPPCPVPIHLGWRPLWYEFTGPAYRLLERLISDWTLRGARPKNVGQPLSLVVHPKGILPLSGPHLPEPCVQFELL